MLTIPNESIPYFENAIYLPMLIKVLEKDLLVIETIEIKLKRPYIKIVDGALNLVRADLKRTNTHLMKNNMKLYKRGTDAEFTEYMFSHFAIEEKRRYSNIRLRNRTEELIGEYFAKVII